MLLICGIVIILIWCYLTDSGDRPEDEDITWRRAKDGGIYWPHCMAEDGEFQDARADAARARRDA